MIRSAFVEGIAAVASLRMAPSRASPIKIGYIDSLSGPLADVGHRHRAGVEIALEAANRRGSVRHELVLADDASRPAVGVTEARRLIDQEKVDVLMLGTSSAVTLAIAPIGQQSGIFTIAIGAQDTSITGEKATPYLYRFAPNVQMQIRALAQRVLLFGKRWYFIVDDFAHGKDAYARLSAFLKDAGGSQSGADILSVGTIDFSPSLTKLRNTDAEVLVLCQGGFDAAKTAKQFVDFGLHTMAMATRVTTTAITIRKSPWCRRQKERHVRVHSLHLEINGR
jgi:branched-chain amino acid transport system substrate-binding protein